MTPFNGTGSVRSQLSRSNVLTSCVYGSASAACSLFLLVGNQQQGGQRSALLLLGSCVFGIPLLFAFAYPRFLFSNSVPNGRQRLAALLHGLGALSAIVLFPLLALPFWKNPVSNNDESVAVVVIILIVLVVFSVAAFSLLLKGRSSFATFAALLFWPYWLALALANASRFFQETRLGALCYFFCFLAPVALAFAAGTISYRPALAHAAALLGFLATPWLYWNAVRDPGLGNVWLVFNVPDKGMMSDSLMMYAQTAIFAVALVILAISTAFVRLSPHAGRFRTLRLCERTWPAVAMTFIVLTIWFSRSVMPYRMPGAVDRSDWPILQILHVEKRGLQFHETCVNVWSRLGGRPSDPVSVSVTRNSRRLFEYRFVERSTAGQLTEPLIERIRAIIPPSDGTREQSGTVKPIRDWNADAWYFNVRGSALKVYSTAHGSAPREDIVALFHELEKIPQSSETPSEMKDVCLGFCYDPISGLGRLYENERCFNFGHGTVCR